MNRKILVSVIVPCYKVEKYLPKCVDSILGQSYKNLEIWLVDDGSPDNCGQICDNYAKKDSRIKVIHKQNGGLSDARNVAIDQAAGDWITFVDSDDYLDEDYVKVLLDTAVNNNCELSISDYLCVTENKANKEIRETVQLECYEPYEALKKIFYQKGYDHNAWGKLYHKRLFSDGIRYPNGLVFEDFATTYRLILRCKKVAFINKKTYYYLLRDSSIEGNFNPKKVEDGLKVINMLEDDEELLTPVKKAYVCRKFSFYLHLYLQMPPGAAHIEEIEHFIRKKRLSLLLDFEARSKARLAALISYFGFGAIRFVFNRFANKR